jgi:putative hydrolase of the HAD superfamily
MKKVRSLILDLGGVLTLPQRLDKARELRDLLGAECPLETFLEAYFAPRLEYDRGTIDGRAYWQAVASKLGAAEPGPRADELVRVDLESWFNMRGRMLRFLEEAKGRIRSLVLLSNLHEDAARFIRSASSGAWPSLFDELVFSCDHRLVKPEAGIYSIAVEAARAAADECLFIDDSQANVEGARSAGLQSFRFVDEDDCLGRIERDFELSA